MFGYLVLLGSDDTYDAVVENEKYSPEVRLFHSMFRVAVRAFGIDVHQSGFFADATTLYNLWSTKYGELLATSQTRPSGKYDPDSCTYGYLGAGHDSSFPSEEDPTASHSGEKKYRDMREQFKQFFPDFDMTTLNERALYALSGGGSLLRHHVRHLEPTPIPLHWTCKRRRLI